MKFLSRLAFRILASWGGVATTTSSLPGLVSYSGNDLRWIPWTSAEPAYKYVEQPKSDVLTDGNHWETIYEKLMKIDHHLWNKSANEICRYKNNLAIAAFFNKEYHHAIRLLEEAVQVSASTNIHKLAFENKHKIDLEVKSKIESVQTGDSSLHRPETEGHGQHPRPGSAHTLHPDKDKNHLIH